MTNANKKREQPSISHPSHHAPSQRGSLLSIVGVKSGEIYIFKQKLARAYPPAGPRSLRKYEKPRRKIIN